MDSLRALRQLVTLAEVGRYRTASERLGITHSALSQAVRRIEDHYGVPLFTRQHGRLVPTDCGRLIIDSAKATLDAFEGTVAQIDQLKTFKSGRFTVGTDTHLAKGLVAPALGRLVARYPQLRFSIRTQHWNRMQDELRSRAIDLYIGLAPDERAPDIRMEDLALPGAVTVCRAGHPLAQMENPSVADVLNYPIASGATPDWNLRDLMDLFPRPKPNLWQLKDHFVLTYDLSVLPEVILASDAIGHVPYMTMRSAIKSGQAVVLSFCDVEAIPPTTGVIATLDHGTQPPAVHALREEIHGLMGFKTPATF